MRKDFLASGSTYHIFSRSISKFKIFNTNDDYLRMMEILDLYRYFDFSYKYSQYIILSLKHRRIIKDNFEKNGDPAVEFIAYCIMPTHFHLILKQLKEGGISRYMSKVLNSYSRFFNLKHGRKGPLWEGRFKNVVISTDEQLLHLTRYIHLNPVSANLVRKPESWRYSTYNEYLKKNQSTTICKLDEVLALDKINYKKFVNDRISFQKELSKIKNLTIDQYSG